MASSKTLPGDLLTPHQVAQILTLDIKTVYSKIRAGEIPFVDLSRRARRVRRADLEAYIETRVRGGHQGTTKTATVDSLADYWTRPSPSSAVPSRNGVTR